MWISAVDLDIFIVLNQIYDKILNNLHDPIIEAASINVENSKAGIFF